MIEVLRFGFFGFTRKAGDGVVIVSNLKHGGLFGGVALQFVEIEFGGVVSRHAGFVFALDAALSFVALFLLASMFFLAFGEAGSSSSRHRQSPIPADGSAQRLKPR